MQATQRPIAKIAHVSDVHILDPRPSRSRAPVPMSVRYLNLGRAIDPLARRRQFARALAAARRSGADHVVISGDLTELGELAEFEAVAEALHESEIDPDRITLVPGNHDAYSSLDGWRLALEGPLAAFAASSAGAPGKVVERGEICFLPVDVSRHQHFMRSAGELTPTWAEGLERRVADRAFRHSALVVVQHHPPFLRVPGLDWIDGLRGGERLMKLLRESENVAAMHGHLHVVADRVAGPRENRIFGAPAIVDDGEDARVRLYEVRDGRVASAGLAR